MGISNGKDEEYLNRDKVLGSYDSVGHMTGEIIPDLFVYNIVGHRFHEGCKDCLGKVYK